MVLYSEIETISFRRIQSGVLRTRTKNKIGLGTYLPHKTTTSFRMIQNSYFRFLHSENGYFRFIEYEISPFI
jgi:hypothetical protein